MFSQDTFCRIYNSFISYLDPLLKNLDPSMFQSVIIGILTIFIPFAIVFLSDVLGSKKTRSEFEKLVLNDEVFKTKKLFLLSIFSLSFFTFFTGIKISTELKVLSILFLLLFIFLFWRSFIKLLKFSEGRRSEFEKSFLIKLKLFKIFKSQNKERSEKMIQAWGSFWGARSEFRESEFAKTFSSHINDILKNGNPIHAIELAQTFLINIEKQNIFLLGSEILPKTFEWDKALWEKQQKWLKDNKKREKIQRLFPKKYLPTFRLWITWLIKKLQRDIGYFWNWHYFRNEFFQSITKVLLEKGEGYQLFSCLNNHIKENEIKLDKITDDTRKNRHWSYITGLFSSFFTVFFENIEKNITKNSIWDQDFPGEWKITVENLEKRPPRIILHEFIQWAQKRFLMNNDQQSFDKDLSEVVGGLFPTVNPTLFSSFLVLLFSPNIKSAIKKKTNFYIFNQSSSGIFFSGKEDENEIKEIFEKEDQSQREETVKIIYNFFSQWRIIKVYKEDLTEKEISDWELSEQKRNEIQKLVRQKKIQNMVNELDSKEVIQMCKESDEYEYRKKELMELFTEMLKYL